MDYRVSCVGKLSIVRADENGMTRIGDTVQIRPVTNAIAVQRERAIFFDQEFQFMDYALFSRPLVKPVIEENVKMSRINLSPVIKAEEINLLLLAANSIVHIGSCGELRAESRIKHIRHLLRERPPKS